MVLSNYKIGDKINIKIENIYLEHNAIIYEINEDLNHTKLVYIDEYCRKCKNIASYNNNKFMLIKNTYGIKKEFIKQDELKLMEYVKLL